MRDKWSSNIGFILASAGSAIGLGNLWKFPYMVGKNGGGSFVIIYLVLLLTIGLSLVLGETAIGRATQKNVYGAYGSVSKRFAKTGILCVITGFLILCFYSSIGGWTVKYVFTYLVGGVHGDSSVYFRNFTASPWQTVLCQLIFLAATALIVGKGISGGIEKYSKVMMSALFVILVVLAVRSLTLPGAMEGVRFFLKPDFSKITVETVIDALGQAFFSLSVGMGTLITYGSYMKKDTNLQKTTVFIPLLDTVVAMLAGFAILPAVFSFGFQPSEGPGLTFVTIPAIFESMFGGRWFGLLFFVLLLFAALTSSISMLEVMVSFVVEEKGVKRNRAVWLLIGLTVLGAVPCALSENLLADFKLWGKTVFGLFDFTASNLLMPIGGILMCIFVGYIWKSKSAIREITNDGKLRFPLAGVWTAIIKYIAPAAILLIFVWALL